MTAKHRLPDLPVQTIQWRVDILTGDHEGCTLSPGAAPPVRFNRAVPHASQAQGEIVPKRLIALDVEQPGRYPVKRFTKSAY